MQIENWRIRFLQSTRHTIDSLIKFFKRPDDKVGNIPGGAMLQMRVVATAECFFRAR